METPFFGDHAVDVKQNFWMKLFRHAFLCSCLLVILAFVGCATSRRDRFLSAHSLDRFLVDRPKAAQLLEQHPELAEWLRKEWSQPIVDYRIYWSDEKSAISMADHGFILDYKLIVIRISRNLSPADQLTALSFEIYNAQEFSGIDDLVGLAKSGKITRENYIRRKSEQEHRAVLRVAKILRILLPLSKNEVSDTNLYRHTMEAPTDFNEYHEWNSRIPNSNYLRALRHYGEEYDGFRRKTP